MFIASAEFNRLSFADYRNGILHSERKILAKIQPSVMLAHMVDFHKPNHICDCLSKNPTCLHTN